MDEYYDEKIVAHEEKGKNPKNWKLNVRWIEYEPEEDSWVSRTAVQKTLQPWMAAKETPETSIGLTSVSWLSNDQDFVEESIQFKLLRIFGYTDVKPWFWLLNCIENHLRA